MRITILLLFLLITTHVEAADYFIREDGGNKTECTGLVDAPKNATKKCAWNTFYQQMTFSATSTDTITIKKGTYMVSVQPPDIWIPMSTFVASPLQYVTAVKNGRKVYFSDLGGIAWELQLRKY